jgi:uncharacterized repeat protein (TIGR01451 family)
MPFAQMAAATRGLQRSSELSYQRSKVSDGQLAHRTAKNGAANNLFEPVPATGSPIIGATLTDNRPTTDPAVANPGDTIHYTATISNTGTADATGVQFNDDVDANTTVVGGSVKMSPLAFPDSYNGTPNSPLNVAAAQGVLANDTGIPAPTAVPINNGSTSQGGTVTLNSDGSFTYNTPANNFTGADTFTYTATNGQLPNDTATVTIAIACQTITVTNPVSTTGTVSSVFSQNFTQGGAIGTPTFTTASTLPTGLSLTTAGVLSGTPTQTGSFPIVVTVTDANGCTGTGATYTLVIGCQTITVTNPVSTTGTVSSVFSQNFAQSGAIGTPTFTTASTLPTGLSLSSAGVLSGTPTQTGTFPIVVTVTDANGCTGTGAPYTLVIGCQTVGVNNPANNSGTLGSPFSENFTQTGAQGSATFTTASTLPVGLTLSSAGLLFGTPTQAGTFPIVVTVTDSNGCTGTGATYNLVTSCQTITVTNPANSTGQGNVTFSEQFSQTGGVGTITWSETGPLPSGLTFHADTGVLDGTPATGSAGTYPINVTATDQNGCQGTGATYNLIISVGPLMFAEGGVLSAVGSPSLLSNFMLPLTASAFPSANRDGRDARHASNASNSISLSLTENQLNDAVAVAIERWSAAGLTQKQIATLSQIKFEVADLAGKYLGEAASNHILVSRDAQRKGWFIDSKTPSSLSFAHAVSSTRLYADPWSAPAGHIDLLTAIEHEIGHKLGLNDTYAQKDRDNLMYGYLTVGERRLPGQNQARYARGVSHAGPHFLSLGANEKTGVGSQESGFQKLNHARNLKAGTRNSKPLTPTPDPACTTTSTHVCVAVGTLRVAKSVTITFSVTVNSPYGGGTNVSTQGTVSGGNFSNVVTDDPDTGASNDATLTPICANSIVVTANGNSGAGSLRQAILDACPGATITFNVTSPITLSSELVIDKNLTIQGPTSPGLTISGNNVTRILNVNSGVNLSISNLTIANGLASSGGGILNAGTLTITNSTISNNHTTNGANSSGPGFNGGNGGDGGGVYNTGTLNVINSTISGNQPGNGGDASGTDTSGNGGNGGGVYNSGGTLTSVNTTITNNKTGANGDNTTTTPTPGPFGNPGTGGGLYSSGGTVILRNTIVAGNFSVFQKLGPPRSFANSDDDVNGTVDSLSSFNNLIGTDAGLSGISNGSNGNKIGTVGTPLSADLAPLANNGGPTLTHLPQNGSPVIDAGSNALAKDQNNIALATDQRGTGFARILNGTVEIGAVEVNYGPPGSSADVGVTKSSNPNSALPDTNVTYTITVSNNGPNVATNATLTDPLPAGVTFVSLSSPGGWLCNSLTPGSGGTLTCTNPNLPLTVGAVFTLVVHIDPGATLGSFITNQAQVSTSAFDPDNENDSSAASTLVIGPTSDLGVTKLASAGTSPADRDVRYTITVTNGGPAAAANVALNDTLPGDMTFVSVFSPAGWSCASHPAVGAGGTVTCTNPSLAVTSGQVFTLTGHIPPGASNGTFYFNQATVSSSTSDPNPDNNSSPAGTTVVACVTDPVVTSNADSGAGSLRQAIIDACDGATIAFDMTQVVSPITLTSAELAINKNLTIQGPGANLLTVQRSTAGGTPRFRIFNIQSGTVNISGLTISNGDNLANGGAIENLGALTLNRLTLSNNHTSAGGSAIFNSSTGTVALSNSTLSGNQSDGFAAVYNQGGAFTITNSTLTGNTNVGNSPGVAIYSESSSVTNVTNSTISKNTGQAEAVYQNSGSGSVNLKNSIVSGNIGGDVSGITDNGNNLIGGNPLLAPLGNYGGPTQTMALLPGSPAINAGTSTGAPATDQRGVSRVGAVDIGAFESRGFTISATSGNAQSTPILTAFGTPLVATVSSAFSEPVAAGMVIFTAPGSGASATFTGGVTTFNATINGGGQATATPTANGTAGGPYNVAATANGISSTATFSLTNQKSNQTITFGPLANKAFGDPDFGVSATASSGLPVSFAALGNCTVSGSTVHLTGGGSCTVTASQGGGTNYNAAPNVQQSFNIAKGSQTITFGALVNKTFGDPDFGVSATASSGLAVSFAGLGNCTVSGSTVHLTGGGSCTITAMQGGDSNYNAAANVPQSFTIARSATTTALSSSINPSDIGQNVTFTATVSAGVGTPTGTVQFKDGANNLGGAINCVAGGGNTCTAQVSSSTLTTGTHTITAIYSGDTNFSGSTGTLSGGQVVTNQPALLLILDQSGPDPNQAAALDALLLLRDPFHVQSVATWWNFGPAPDRNTRVMVFVANLQLNPGETSAAVVVNLIDSNSLSYDVAASDIRLDPITGFAQVTFRLPDTLFPGTCTLTVKAHGHVSNSATMRIAP